MLIFAFHRTTKLVPLSESILENETLHNIFLLLDTTPKLKFVFVLFISPLQARTNNAPASAQRLVVLIIRMAKSAKIILTVCKYFGENRGYGPSTKIQ